jgi:hypothetical protein
MIHPQILGDSHKTAQQAVGSQRGLRMADAGIIVFIRILAIIVIASFIYQYLKEKS